MLKRREFFQVLGGGILVILTADDDFAQRRGGRGFGGGGSMPKEIGAWIHIGETGSITVFAGKAEVGQNARTSLAQAVAEELHAPLGSIHMVVGDTDLCPYDGGTSGSRTTPGLAPQIHKAGAATRELLIDLAAEQWKCDRSSLAAADGRIVNAKTGQSAGFGAFTKGQKLMKTIADDVRTTPATEWKVVGKSFPKINGRELVTGQHQYPSDISRPGMLHGKVLRPPSFNATLTSVDTREAEAMSGVTVVHDGNFVGVAAPDVDTAERALGVIRAKWDAPQQPSSRELFTYLKANAGEGGGGEGFGGRSGGGSRGSIEQGEAAADQRFKQTYTVAYIQHVPLEPRAAVAEWQDGKLTVWTGSQQVFGVRGSLAQTFGLTETRVRVIVPDPGSGYGGKHTGDAALEAARLAKAAGKPVKVVWTREEEFTWAYFRPAGVIEVKSGVRKDGTLTAWEFHNYNSGGSGIGTMYDIPNQKTAYHPSKPPLHQSSYRALSATANHFAREVHMDEIARALRMDPLEFRLKNLKDERFRAVLSAAAEKFGWSRRKAPWGRGFGIAGGFEKASYVACCAEVSVTNGKVKIHRAVEAFDCGAIVNPDQLKNQVEGAVIMAIGGALFEAIEFDNGKILNPHLSSYRVPRFSDVPQLEVVLVDRKDIPSAGAGETPIVVLAPAVCNAIFDATGQRLCSMPMKLA
jgi:isoquinoline 1-oxidoreductase